MKKTLAFAALAQVLTLTSAAFATGPTPPPPPTPNPSNSSALTLQGSVPQISSIPSPGAPTNATNASLSGTALTVTSLADSAGHAKDWEITLPFSGVSANYKAKIAVTSMNGALKNSVSTTDAGSTNLVKYHAEAEWGSNVSATLDADGASAPLHVQSADDAQQTADLSLRIRCVGSENPKQLVSGQYNDTLTVAIGENP